MTEKRGELWGASDAYEMYMGRWSRRIAPQFLSWLGPASDASWVDIGCGTGVLCEAILLGCSPKAVLGIDSSAAFVEAATSRIKDARFKGEQGSAEAVGAADESMDYAVSGLLLNFVPDKARSIEEMVRVTVPGGKSALYVWDYAGHMQIMRHFFDAALELDANAKEYDDGIKAPICRPAPLRQLFEGAGLKRVSVEAIDIPTSFESFAEYWKPFLGGTGSAPKYFASLDPESQVKLEKKVRQRIPTGPDGEILLAARAWAVQGTKD